MDFSPPLTEASLILFDKSCCLLSIRTRHIDRCHHPLFDQLYLLISSRRHSCKLVISHVCGVTHFFLRISLAIGLRRDGSMHDLNRPV